MIHRLKNYYRTAVMEKLLHHEDFDWSNPHQIPRLSKIVINRGIGDASQNARILESSHAMCIPELDLCSLFTKHKVISLILETVIIKSLG